MYTFADDLAELIVGLATQEVTQDRFSMDGGEVTRNVERNGTTRLTRIALVSAV